jgi:hypothetical protein
LQKKVDLLKEEVLLKQGKYREELKLVNAMN